MATTIVPGPILTKPPPTGPKYYVRPQHVPRFQGTLPQGMPPTGTANMPPVQQQQPCINSATGQAFDGKHLRKAILRRTVDYNAALVNYVQNRLWQKNRRDTKAIQPDVLFAGDVMPPPGHMNNLMNCVTTKFVRTSTNKIKCPIFCLVWTPEGRRLVTGASSGEFTLWNGLTFNFETILQAHDTSIRTMKWSHSDQWMITGDHSGFIKYWQSNMNNVKMFQAHKDPVRGISFCPTDQKFSTCSDDGTVRVWDFIRCHEERILRGHGADVKCVDWHPQKALLVSGSKDTQQPLKLWDPRTGNSLATIHAHKHTVMHTEWNRNGNWLLSASRDHLVKLFDIRNLKEELQMFKGHKKEATTVAWHPIHESLFASGGSDGSIMFWVVGSDKEVGAMDNAHDNMVWSLAWHPMGHILASGSNDHSTRFWTRNRPGDNMRDRFNLNTMPVGHDDMFDDGDVTVPNLPGMGLEHGLPEHLKPKEAEDKGIPGLDVDEIALLQKVKAESEKKKKVPFSRPIPKNFENAWSSGIQPLVIHRSAEEEAHDRKGDGSDVEKSDSNIPGLDGVIGEGQAPSWGQRGRGRGRGNRGHMNNRSSTSGIPSLFDLGEIKPVEKTEPKPSPVAHEDNESSRMGVAGENNAPQQQNWSGNSNNNMNSVNSFLENFSQLAGQNNDNSGQSSATMNMVNMLSQAQASNPQIIQQLESLVNQNQNPPRHREPDRNENQIEQPYMNDSQNNYSVDTRNRGGGPMRGSRGRGNTRGGQRGGQRGRGMRGNMRGNWRGR